MITKTLMLLWMLDPLWHGYMNKNNVTLMEAVQMKFPDFNPNRVHLLLRAIYQQT